MTSELPQVALGPPADYQIMSSEACRVFKVANDIQKFDPKKKGRTHVHSFLNKYQTTSVRFSWLPPTACPRIKEMAAVFVVASDRPYLVRLERMKKQEIMNTKKTHCKQFKYEKQVIGKSVDICWLFVNNRLISMDYPRGPKYGVMYLARWFASLTPRKL